ncbi:hypothetical protein HGRIS_000875 [Hohenbuehelia grisea]
MPEFMSPPRHKPVDGFIYGYSYFTQRRDPSIKRGYRQRSVTILTSHPYPALFTVVTATLGYMYELSASSDATPTPSTLFANGSVQSPNQLASTSSVIRQACMDISQWPPPIDGSTLPLHFFGKHLEAEFPHAVDGQWMWRPEPNGSSESALQVPAAGPPSLYDPLPLPKKKLLTNGVPEPTIITNASPSQLASSIPPSPALPFDNLVTANALPLLAHSELLPHLWAIWENLVLCEPILVCGNSPAVVGATVWWIAELARGLPLSQSHDMRPYVTIHDQECDALIGARRPGKPSLGGDVGVGLGINAKRPTSGKRANTVGRAGLVIGVTNPWLVRQCADWGCVLRVESAGCGDAVGRGSVRTLDGGIVARGASSPAVFAKQRQRQASGSPAVGSPYTSTPTSNWSPSGSFSSWIASGVSGLSRLGSQSSPRSAKSKSTFAVPDRMMSEAKASSRPGTPRSAGIGPGSPMQGDASGPQVGWKSKPHKRYISKDKVLLKRVEEAWRGGTAREQVEATMLLRQHFNTRTTELLLPLTRYLNTLIPSPAELNDMRSQPSSAGSSAAASPALSYRSPSISSSSTTSGSGCSSSFSVDTQESGVWAEGVRLKAFSRTAFFESLKTNGCPLPFRSSAQRVEFYERWLRCKAFGVWLARQEEVVKDVLQGALA